MNRILAYGNIVLAGLLAIVGNLPVAHLLGICAIFWIVLEIAERLE